MARAGLEPAYQILTCAIGPGCWPGATYGDPCLGLRVAPSPHGNPLQPQADLHRDEPRGIILVLRPDVAHGRHCADALDRLTGCLAACSSVARCSPSSKPSGKVTSKGSEPGGCLLLATARATAAPRSRAAAPQQSRGRSRPTPASTTAASRTSTVGSSASCSRPGRPVRQARGRCGQAAPPIAVDPLFAGGRCRAPGLAGAPTEHQRGAQTSRAAPDRDHVPALALADADARDADAAARHA